MRLNVLLITLFFPIYCFCQLDMGRTYSNSIPAAYNINVDELRQHTYDRIPEKFKSKKIPRRAYKFADFSAVMVRNLLTSGSCYSDWNVLEDYVNQILQNVLPEELKQDTMIRAYIVKDGRYNAFMTGSGIMFLHIGLFAEIKDEATIAGIIAHELAHYYAHHSIERYVKGEKGEFKPGFLFQNKKAFTQFSVGNELDADSLATVWLSQSGYNANGLIHSLEITKNDEKRRLLQYEEKWEFKETTHPDPTKRLDIAHEHGEHAETDGTGKYFLVDKRTFFQLKEQAKSEILKFLLRDFYYDDCIEKAFKFHIQDVENPTYLYYLMEGIRRKCFLDVKDWNKNFITSNYYKIIEKKGDKKKVKMESHLFEKFPSDILLIKPEQLIYLAGKFYWDGEDVKFKTNEEAFLFFNRIAELVNEPECILVNALSVEFDEEKCKPILEKYLANDNIRFKEYAEHLLAKTSKSALENKKLTIINDFRPFIREGEDYVLVRDFSDESNDFLFKLFNEQLKNDPNRTVIYFPNLKASQLEDYTLLKELEQFAYLKKSIRGQNPELHVLDPRYWQLMKKFGVNEIEFVNIKYTDTRKSAWDLESYQEITKMGFKEFLNQTKRSRYIDVYVNSVRSKDKCLMKILHYDEQTELGYKFPASIQIGHVLKNSLVVKDERAQQADARLRSGDLDQYEAPKIFIDGRRVN